MNPQRQENVNYNIPQLPLNQSQQIFYRPHINNIQPADQQQQFKYKIILISHPNSNRNNQSNYQFFQQPSSGANYQSPQFQIQQNTNPVLINQYNNYQEYPQRGLVRNQHAQSYTNLNTESNSDRFMNKDFFIDQSQVIRIQPAQPNFTCIDHQKEIKYIGKDKQDGQTCNSWKLKCQRCFERKLTSNEQMIKLSDVFINIYKFLIDPINQILHQINQPSIENLLDNIQKDFKNTLKISLTDILKQVQQIDIQLKLLLDYQDLKNAILEKMSFDEFKDQIKQQKSPNLSDDKRKKLQKKLQQQINEFHSQKSAQMYIEEVQKFVSRKQQEIDQHIQSFYQLQELSQQLFQVAISNLEDQKVKLDQALSQITQKIGQQLYTQKLIDDLQEFPTIQYLIAQGKKIEYELIYQGSEHGLDSEEYWKRCNLQDNLLTIMISENGNVFGGFSPCLLDCTTPQYIQDPTLKSFLFQYNKRQIYRLKDKKYAVYANRNQGPTFGNGHDLTINSDFKYGNTNNLGLSYDTSNYQIEDKYTHLFGYYNPKLIEIKVYRIDYAEN